MSSEIRHAQPGPFLGGKNLVNQVAVVVGGHSYTVWAGGGDEDRTQGRVIVFRFPEDVCNHPEDSGSLIHRLDPRPGLGPLVITAVENGRLRLTRSDGSIVIFDVATSTFV